MGGDGVVDPFNDPILAGFYWQEYWDEDDLGLTEDDCVPSLAPPIPVAPPLNLVGGGDKLLEFTAPPEGGSYVLAVAWWWPSAPAARAPRGTTDAKCGGLQTTRTAV